MFDRSPVFGASSQALDVAAGGAPAARHRAPSQGGAPSCRLMERLLLLAVGLRQPCCLQPAGQAEEAAACAFGDRPCRLPALGEHDSRLTKCVISVPQGELSLIEQLLPEELLLHIFERLPITALATSQLVCRQWRRVAATQTLWRRACMCVGAGGLFGPSLARSGIGLGCRCSRWKGQAVAAYHSATGLPIPC